MKVVEPPSCSSLSDIVFIGRDRNANGSPRNRMDSMAASSSAAPRLSNTRCQRTPVIPKPSSNFREKSSLIWAATETLSVASG
jgi:hypothetical protein